MSKVIKDIDIEDAKERFGAFVLDLQDKFVAQKMVAMTQMVFTDNVSGVTIEPAWAVHFQDVLITREGVRFRFLYKSEDGPVDVMVSWADANLFYCAYNFGAPDEIAVVNPANESERGQFMNDMFEKTWSEHFSSSAFSDFMKFDNQVAISKTFFDRMTDREMVDENIDRTASLFFGAMSR